MSKRNEIIAAIVAALNAELPDGVPACQRTRTSAINSDAVPAIILYPGSETAERHNRGPVVKRELTLRIECKAAATSDEAVEEAIEPMLEHISRTLGVSRRLGSLVNEVSEQNVTWHIEASDYVYCTAVVEFVVSYTTTD